MHYLGGFDITDIFWAGRNAVGVVFDHGGNYTAQLFQLYAGRRLIGVTDDVSQTLVIGQVPAGSACPLGIVAVDIVERLSDFGSNLDLRPWNVYRLGWEAPADPSPDLHHFDIVAGRNPGDDYDATNIVARVPATGAPSYSYVLPPFPARGDWSLAVIARDDAQPDGNAGSISQVTIPTIIYPWDFVPQSDGRRFLPTIADGELSIAFTYGTAPAFP
jgi:hypothetical protein